MATKIVKFNRHFDKWTTNDIAGFSEGDEVLKEIVNGKFGVIIDTVELSKLNVKIDPSWGKRVPEVKETLICPICGKQSKTKALLTTHKKKVHDIA